MENVFTLIFLLLVILFTAIIWIYARSLIALAKYSNLNNTEIFDYKYKNTYQLMADVSFLNELWSGKRIKDINNKELEGMLLKTRKLLILGMCVGLIMFFTPIIKAVIYAG